MTSSYSALALPQAEAWRCVSNQILMMRGLRGPHHLPANPQNCVFITAVPLIKLFASGEGESGGHVLRESLLLFITAEAGVD